MKLLFAIIIIALLSAVGIFFTTSLDVFQKQEKIRKKLGDKVFNWLIED